MTNLDIIFRPRAKLGTDEKIIEIGVKKNLVHFLMILIDISFCYCLFRLLYFQVTTKVVIPKLCLKKLL